MELIVTAKGLLVQLKFSTNVGHVISALKNPR
jgi:hypothetical protein